MRNIRGRAGAAIFGRAANNSVVAIVPPAPAPADVTAPVISTFSIPTTHTSSVIPVTASATDDTGVTGYVITTSGTPPALDDPGWVGSAPVGYTVGGNGTYNLYLHVKDAAGNTATSTVQSCVVTISTAYTITKYASVDGANAHDGTVGNEYSFEEVRANIQGGDVIQFAPGSYNFLGTGIDTPYFPIPAGTIANPTVLVAQNPAIYNQGAGSGVLTQFHNVLNVGSLLGHAVGTSNVIIDGFDFNAYQNSDVDGAYQIVFFNSTNAKVKNSTFDGQSMATGSGNHGFIFYDGMDDAEIYNNSFKNNSGSQENAAAVMTYGTTNLHVHHNYFDNNETHAFIKGEGVHGKNGSQTWEFNRFYNSPYCAIYIGGHQETTPDINARSFIQQNIFYSNERAVAGVEYAAFASYVSVLNNTFYVSTGSWLNNEGSFMYLSSAVLAGNIGNEFKNNIFMSGEYPFHAEDGGSIAPFTDMDIDGNFYFDNLGIFRGSPSVADLATWQGTYNHDDTAGTQGTNPNFSDIVPTSADFLKLAGGSAALTASTTGGPVGCYITGSEVIGIE